MDKKDLYYNDPTPNIDSRTGFVKGSQEYNDYYFPKKEKSDLYLDPKPIDNLTDFGKGIYFFTCDGKKVATMEEVMAYNNMYYENMKIKKNDDFSQKSGMHR